MKSGPENEDVILALHSRTTTFMAGVVLFQLAITLANANSVLEMLLLAGLLIGQGVALFIYERHAGRIDGSYRRCLILALPSLLYAALALVFADGWWRLVLHSLFGLGVAYAILTQSGGYLRIGRDGFTARLGRKTMALRYNQLVDVSANDISFLRGIGRRFETYLRLRLTPDTKLPGLPFNAFFEKTVRVPLTSEARDRALALLQDKLLLASDRDSDP